MSKSFSRVKPPNVDFIPCGTVLESSFNWFWANQPTNQPNNHPLNLAWRNARSECNFDWFSQCAFGLILSAQMAQRVETILRVKTPNVDFISCGTVLEPILNRFWAELGWPLDPKILQNCIRGVRNQTLRIYTLDGDPMCFRTDFRHPKLPRSCSKMVPRRCDDDPPIGVETIFQGQSPQRWCYPLRCHFGIEF